MAEEMTNQSTPETNDSDLGDLFADALGEESETNQSNDSQSNSEGEQNSTSPAQKQEEPTFLDIKYNGAEEHLTKEQAIEFAQKGRNYDHLKERYENAINSPAMKAMNNLAKRAGLSVDEYVERLDQFQQQSDINRIANQYKQQNPNADDDTVQAYAEQAYQNQLSQEAQAEAQQSQEAQENLQTMAKQQLSAFLKEYPDVDVTQLPEEVKVDIDQNGMTLLDAYRAYDLKITKKALAQERQNTSNRASATGNLSSNAGGTSDADPFLQGLFGK